MKKPSFPDNEEFRVNTLKSLDILDTIPEERFDRVTRMAKRLFSVEIALVSLVDSNRQWFKSSQGLDASETPRDISFCGHTILGDEVFIISDASKDARFSDNPLVTDNPNIRFYAGYPIKTPNGAKIGTLCLIDAEPKEFDTDDKEALIDLATMIEHELVALRNSNIDELTGISNRRGFMTLGAHCIQICKRTSIDATLIFIDLNKFKPINDKFGHQEGDLALKTFSNLLFSFFRESDLCARIGGDEFVVLLANSKALVASTIMTRFQTYVDEYNNHSGKEYELAFSYGAVEYQPEQHASLEDLLSDADALMYKQKQAI
ncbi:diguanylate cyclase [Enterovibrio norvegicus FF-33]|uniref:Diguanylate cyclase n=1 Tax=Enterovibrio norvegicus FF-454 TaxID=1185651 RepID=A0A1E5C8E7_9GAMM|nr:sensor domain-containing diguanylate cyclase [Enterovibrio norvegicus]OEE61770.1 diguanylate cyclase [Enterovibrio norvegicus FF-454]OEE66567.1 diguanylate cyclase [Enterovibrio norvegicus FF-33]OEE85925.1 diguanylate cyclase [Enterovibrio norvegicus FF-162]